MNKETKDDTLDQILLKLVQDKKPANLQQLVDLTKSETGFVQEQEIMQHIIRLESQGKLALKEPLIRTPPELSTYLKTIGAAWYWVTIILATTTALTVFTIQWDSNPLIYIRNILGVIFVTFLPGYSLIKLLFPKKEIDHIERTALSIGISLALVPITGLTLSYTPWGIQTAPITISLLFLTILFATAAIIRQQQIKTE